MSGRFSREERELSDTRQGRLRRQPEGEACPQLRGCPAQGLPRCRNSNHPEQSREDWTVGFRGQRGWMPDPRLEKGDGRHSGGAPWGDREARTVRTGAWTPSVWQSKDVQNFPTGQVDSEHVSPLEPESLNRFRGRNTRIPGMLGCSAWISNTPVTEAD